MKSKVFKKLITEILRHRETGWKGASKDVIRLLAKAALKDKEITQEEYDYLIKMLDDDNVLPPPGEEPPKPDKPTIKNTSGNY